MRIWTLPMLLLLVTGCRQKTDLVRVQSVNPRIRLDLRYATTNNFTHQKVYDTAECYLHRPVAEKLSAVENDLEKQGLGLKVYDGYRPLSVQKKFWLLVPDERYVANPEKGSRHNRGAAVDLTLVHASDGSELPMPTGFDDFSERAHRNYRNLPADALQNRAALEEAMKRRGFIPMPSEWWHFDDADWARYPVLDVDFSQIRH